MRVAAGSSVSVMSDGNETNMNSSSMYGLHIESVLSIHLPAWSVVVMIVAVTLIFMRVLMLIGMMCSRERHHGHQRQNDEGEEGDEHDEADQPDQPDQADQPDQPDQADQADHTEYRGRQGALNMWHSFASGQWVSVVQEMHDAVFDADLHGRLGLLRHEDCAGSLFYNNLNEEHPLVSQQDTIFRQLCDMFFCACYQKCLSSMSFFDFPRKLVLLTGDDTEAVQAVRVELEETLSGFRKCSKNSNEMVQICMPNIAHAASDRERCGLGHPPEPGYRHTGAPNFASGSLVQHCLHLQ